MHKTALSVLLLLLLLPLVVFSQKQPDTDESFLEGADLLAEIREVAQRGVVLPPDEDSAFERAQAGRLLLEEGIEGLQDALESTGVPPLTFDQETQVRVVYDDHVRVLEDLLEANGGSRETVQSEIRDIQDQLLLAALKFLNPAQRTALTGSVTAAEFAESNSDLPEDEAELIEYFSDLRSPAGTEGGGGGGSGNWRGGGGGGYHGGGYHGGGGNWSGGGGGGLIIDGFSGGRTPNRDEIQEIRINENSFTSEESNQSRGRTEIITRGGKGRFNGDATFNFADESLDARNAKASVRPPYQRRNFSANLSGPVIEDRLTVTFSLRNNTQENGVTLFALTPDRQINDAITRPAWTKNYTTRATAQLSENNVLNVSYSYQNQRNENQNVEQFRLPEQGSTAQRNTFTVQIKETAVLSRSFNNEVRLRINEFSNEQRPVTTGVHINVRDAFRAGGGTNDSDFSRRQYDFGNLLMYTGRTLALRMGYDGNYQRITSDTRDNFNGTFEFASLHDYCYAIGFPGVNCQETMRIVDDAFALGIPPTYTIATFSGDREVEITRVPTKYSVNLGNSMQEVTQFQSAAFLQSDWRLTNALTLSFGARYEWQQNLGDHNNLDPRFGFAYAIGSNTVLRGGTGTFHQRLELDVVNNLVRFDGTGQRALAIRNPSYPDPFLNGSQGDITDEEVRVRADELTTPYTWNSEATIETSFSGGLILTGSYRFIRGLHLLRSRNLNSPFDSTSPFPKSCFPGQSLSTCVRPDPTRGNINQLESTGTSSNHNFRLGFRQRFSFLNLNGSYNFNSNYDDVGWDVFNLPADNFDLDSEWGRSGARHGYNMSANLRLPWSVNANTSFNWNSGDPYTLRTGTDDNQDTGTYDRPLGVPRNSLTGPSFFEVGLNLSKAVQLRSDFVEVGENGGGRGPVGSGGYYGQRTGVRMTLSASVTNLFNNVNFRSFSGVQTSPFFGKATRARNPRQISLSARFDF